MPIYELRAAACFTAIPTLVMSDSSLAATLGTGGGGAPGGTSSYLSRQAFWAVVTLPMSFAMFLRLMMMALTWIIVLYASHVSKPHFHLFYAQERMLLNYHLIHIFLHFFLPVVLHAVLSRGCYESMVGVEPLHMLEANHHCKERQNLQLRQLLISRVFRLLPHGIVLLEPTADLSDGG